MEPSSVLAWHTCDRLGSHWRGFSQQVHTEKEQDFGTSSKASSETAEKTEANADKADGKKPESEKAEAESDKVEAEKAATAEPEQELTPIERLQKDLEDFQEKSRAKKKELHLGLADYQNNNKKFMKERESRRRGATANFARRMVDVYEEFESLPAFNAEAVKEEGSPCFALQEGVSLTRDLFKKALEKSNVEQLPVELGTPVVNSRHEVVGSTPGDGSLPVDSIAEVIEAGWVMDLRSSTPQVLSKAKVKKAGEATA
jgi:molecular chaperone GrpE (heat shock protein)